MIRRRLLLFALCLAMLPSLADELAVPAPVRLRADRIEIDQRKSVSRYQGNVLLTHGTLKLTAQRAETRGTRQAVQQVTAEGRPTTFRYRPQPQAQPIEGESQRADYDVGTRQLELTGAVEVRQGRNLLRAASVHYDVPAEFVRAEGNGDKPIYAALEPRRPGEPQPERETRP